MDRPADPVSPRMLLWGVVAPLLLGGFVPALSGLAMVWLLCGLGTLLVTAACAVVRRADPGEDGSTRDGSTRDGSARDGSARDGSTLHDAIAGSWWRRPYEPPDVAAARVGSWG